MQPPVRRSRRRRATIVSSREISGSRVRLVTQVGEARGMVDVRLQTACCRRRVVHEIGGLMVWEHDILDGSVLVLGGAWTGPGAGLQLPRLCFDTPVGCTVVHGVISYLKVSDLLPLTVSLAVCRFSATAMVIFVPFSSDNTAPFFKSVNEQVMVEDHHPLEGDVPARNAPPMLPSRWMYRTSSGASESLVPRRSCL